MRLFFAAFFSALFAIVFGEVAIREEDQSATTEISADEECPAGSEDCALQLRQLRALRQQSETNSLAPEGRESDQSLDSKAALAVLGGNPSSKHVRSGPKMYNDLGVGKCMINGGEPEHVTENATEEDCMHMCDQNRGCGGFSADEDGNCTLWNGTRISGGGPEFGEAHCFVKLGYGQNDEYLYKDLGPGKCIKGEEKIEQTIHEHTTETGCKAFCDNSDDCGGYSVNFHDTCLIWNEYDLEGGGPLWDEAHCVAKEQTWRHHRYTYKDMGEGRCVTKSGEVPSSSSFESIGPTECRHLCNKEKECKGYSAEEKTGDCTLWSEHHLKASREKDAGVRCFKKRKHSRHHHHHR